MENVATTIIRNLAENIVQHPKAMAIREEVFENKVFIQIVPSPFDAGKLIGKQGKIFRAMHWLVEQIGERAGKRVTMHRIPHSGHFSDPLPPFKMMVNWPKQEFRTIASDILIHLNSGAGHVDIIDSRTEETEIVFKLLDREYSRYDLLPNAMEDHLGKLFGAAGMKHGRVITVRVERITEQAKSETRQICSTK
jgi:predicted RNA-binding protein YlqC (UPF0109 family)